VPWGWLRVTAPDVGSRFYAFEAGEVLGRLVEGALPQFSGRLGEGCKDMRLAGGTEIRLGDGVEPGKRSCIVVPLPEGCRYLMGMPLNVNRSGTEDLELLPGIGPRLARRIVDVRESSGPFSSPGDLLRVPGVGRRLAERIEGRVTFF